MTSVKSKASLYKYHKMNKYNPSRKIDDEDYSVIVGSYYDNLFVGDYKKNKIKKKAVMKNGHKIA